MGEVYRAIDTNLKRAIAIKVLPTSVAADAERLARFQREAEVLASLNHPHIAAIYGLEDADGVKALVLELVEGPTLADRIAQGPIPLDEAIPIARQIAEAVEAAHEQGIIHRDLKPANIKLRSDGTVKVLDFGLAKALDPLPTSIDASQSAAITSPAMTGMGVIMGTAAYMSAEQARGKAVDKRSDIWAFGCVLYEMLTGRRAFEGEDISDTLANVLKIDPNWQALPAEVPAAIRALLRRCLDKDRRTRVADISTALFVLDEAAGLRGAVEGPAEVGPYVRGEVSRWRRVVPAAGALIVGGAIVGGAVWWSMRTAPPAVVRTTIATTESTALVTAGGERDVAITPDGSRIVYRGTNQLLGTGTQSDRARRARRSRRGQKSVHLPQRTVDRVCRRTDAQESGDHGRATRHDCSRGRPTARRHVGTGRDHCLRDLRAGDRPAARILGRRRAHGAHEARS